MGEYDALCEQLAAEITQRGYVAMGWLWAQGYHPSHDNARWYGLSDPRAVAWFEGKEIFTVEKERAKQSMRYHYETLPELERH